MDRIGKYEIVSEIGRGGFGVVYRAVDPTVGRDVAIKVLLAGPNTSLLQRFRREAIAIGRLHHRSVVTLHDFGEHDGAPFLVMEFLEGQDLGHAIRTSYDLTILERVSILLQIAEGLDHAHMHGVLHRDVKPANVMLLKDGTIKLMDFGISRLTREASLGITPTGGVVGTFQYLAPEQFRGQAQDERSDIFSYGVLGYELLCGKHPFDAPDVAAMMYKVTELDPPPLSSLSARIPESLERVIHTALEKNSQTRQQSFGEVLVELRPIELSFKQEAASALIAQSRIDSEAGRHDASLASVRRALELDPSNPNGRRLHESLVLENRRRAVRPQVEALVLKAQSALAARNFREAAQDLESALRLAPSDTDLREQVEHAQTLRQRAECVETERAAAQLELTAGNFAQAKEHAQAALQADPENIAAQELIDVVRKAEFNVARASEFAERLASARKLLSCGEIIEALFRLESLREGWPESTEVQRLLEQAELKRRALLERDRELDRAKTLATADAFDDAIALLNHLDRVWPQDAEIENLLDTFITQRKHLEQVAEALTLAATRKSSHDFCGAIQVLSNTLTLYPTDARLLAALGETAAFQKLAEEERLRAEVREIVARCEILREHGLLVEALQCIDEALQQYESETVLQQVKQSLLEDLNAKVPKPVDREIIEDPGLNYEPESLPTVNPIRTASSSGLDMLPMRLWGGNARKRLVGGILSLAILIGLWLGIVLRTRVSPSQHTGKPDRAVGYSVSQTPPATNHKGLEEDAPKSNVTLPTAAKSKGYLSSARNAPSRQRMRSAVKTALPAGRSPINASKPPLGSVKSAATTVVLPVSKEAHLEFAPLQQSRNNGALTAANPEPHTKAMEIEQNAPNRTNALISPAPSQQRSTDFIAARDANTRGIHLFNLHMNQEAVVNFTEAIRLRPDATVYFNRGASYYAMGEYRRALDDLNQALSLKPDYPVALALKKQVEENLTAGVQGPGNGVVPPVLLNPIAPKATPDARHAGVLAKVLLYFVVDEKGRASGFKVLESPGFGLDAEAIKAVRKAKFRPAQRDGKFIPFGVRLEIQFH